MKETPPLTNLSFLACHLLGQITLGSGEYPATVQFAIPKGLENAQKAEGDTMPTTEQLLEEIFDSVIEDRGGSSIRRFRIFESCDISDGVATVRLTKDYLAWPGHKEIAKIPENARTPKTLH
jgi:hypothetical protein